MIIDCHGHYTTAPEAHNLWRKVQVAAFDARQLGFFGDLAHLANPAAFVAHLAAARRVDWIVYAKKPFGGPAQVLAYLGRYTHRVAIANSRIRACDDDHVAFAWKIPWGGG